MSSNAHKLLIGYMYDVLPVCQANAHKHWTRIRVMCYRYVKQYSHAIDWNMCDVLSVCQAMPTSSQAMNLMQVSCVIDMSSNAHQLWIGYMGDVLPVYQANAHTQWTGTCVIVLSVCQAMLTSSQAMD